MDSLKISARLWFDTRRAHAGNATFSQRKVQLAALQDLTWLEPEITKHTHFHAIDKKRNNFLLDLFIRYKGAFNNYVGKYK